MVGQLIDQLLTLADQQVDPLQRRYQVLLCGQYYKTFLLQLKWL